MLFTVFDIETTGLDTDTVDVHCGSLVSTTGPQLDFANRSVAYLVDVLNTRIEEGHVLSGHNIIEFDIPILKRFGLHDPPLVYDTMVVSRATYPGGDLFNRDTNFLANNSELKESFPRHRPHSLQAWGYRLGCPKDEYTGGWEFYSQDMLDYCAQDVRTNMILLEKLRSRIPDEAALLECQVAQICRDMRLHGVSFDVEKAVQFSAELIGRREAITKEMKAAFPAWYVPESKGTVEIPKRTQCSKKAKPGEEGYRNVAVGAGFSKVKAIEFNPASTDHIADRLMKVRGWKPKQFTDGGKPKVTAEILRDLKYPEAELLAEYQEVKKVLGYLAEGNNAWLKLEKKGRLHGKVLPTGTVSGRASHSSPNTGNVPTRSTLGHKCRELFRATPGKVLVGADASQLQLRLLAHHLAVFDGGSFARQIEEGDVHEYMRQATGLYTRNRQKTWTYAKLFGASAPRLGRTVVDDIRDALEQGLYTGAVPKQNKVKELGVQSLNNLGDAIPAFPMLDADLKAAAAKGYLIAIDGHKVPVGSEHLAIAMLLQSGEACVMKKAFVIAVPRLLEVDAHIVLWVHDEFQAEATKEKADAVGGIMVDALREAGEFYNLAVKIDGEFKVGTTWAETH